MVDQLTKVDKKIDELDTKLTVQGNNNTQNFHKMDSKIDNTISISEKNSEQLADSNKVTAEKIGEVSNKVESSQNSSWMVWGIVGVVAIIAVIAVIGMVYVVEVLIENIKNVDEAIDE